jgi:hypothetical protein
MKLTNPKPLPITYITDIESQKRALWFTNVKCPVLDDLTLRQEGGPENKRLDFFDVQAAIDFFAELTINLNSGDGVRMYFSSPASDGSVNKGKCGKLTLIFVATKGIGKIDVLPYYAFDGNTFIPTDKVEVEKGIQNYQLIKRDYLFKTLSYNDRLNGNKETKHIWFSLDQIEQTINEMIYQSQRLNTIVKKFGIFFTSYTDHDYTFFGSKPPYKLRERLTIGFTFMKEGDLDIGIQEIDPVEFAERLKITRERFYGDTFDTGIPAPPPSGDDNRAALDIQM